jgi:hypothetical protein
MDIVKNGFNAVKTLTVNDFLKVDGINCYQFTHKKSIKALTVRYRTVNALTIFYPAM